MRHLDRNNFSQSSTYGISFSDLPDTLTNNIDLGNNFTNEIKVAH